MSLVSARNPQYEFELMTRRRLSINWELVDERRVAAGLSRSELVARLGSHGFAGPARLWRDDNHDDVALRTLERLCEVLDLHPVEFVAPTRNQHRRNMPPTPASVAADDAVLEAALATVPRRRTRARLAELLGWTLPRLTAAIAALEQRLDHAGIRVEHDPDRGDILGLRPRDGLLTRQQRETLHQPGPSDLGLDEPTARALYEIAVIGRSVSESDKLHQSRQHPCAAAPRPGPPPPQQRSVQPQP